MSKRPAVIRSMAYALPRRQVGNQESPYRDIPNIPENWWVLWGCDNRGILNSEGGEYVEDLATRTSAQALELAGISAKDVDLIVANSSSIAVRGKEGWGLVPRIGPRLKAAIGARSAVAWDVEHECMSYLATIQIAVNYLRQGRFKRVLICSAEHSTNSMDFTDPSATIFGDGVVSTVITSDAADGELLSAAYESNSERYRLATVEWRYPTAKPKQQCTPNDFWSYFTLKKDAPEQMQQFVPLVVPAMVNKCLEKAGLKTDDVDYFVFHQPSQLLVNLWASNLGIGPDRFSTTMQDYGCMISASMPVTAHHAIRAGKIKPGSLVIIAGAAVGWSYGAQLWRWGDTRIVPCPA